MTASINPAVVAAILGLILALSVQVAGVVIWGARLSQRVKSLEQDVEPLKQLPIQFARMEVKLDGLLEQFKDMNASMRWLRTPVQDDLRNPSR
jgi:hypothetical protein